MEISSTGLQAYAGLQSYSGTPAVAASGVGGTGTVDPAAADEQRRRDQEAQAAATQDSRKTSGYTTPTRGSNLNIVV